MNPRDLKLRRVFTPSTAWMAAAIAVAVGAVASSVAAGALALTSSRTVDDLALTAEDVALAVESLADAEPADADEQLRHTRNALDAEAISITAPDGRLMRSTAGSLVQTSIGADATSALIESNPTSTLVESSTRIDVDGVVEWMPGAEVVQVVAPLGDGNGVVITYDPNEILARRQRATEGSPLVVPLTLFAIVFGLTGILLEAARRHMSSANRIRDDADTVRDEATEAREALRSELESERNRNQLRSRSTVSITHEQRTLLTGVLTGAELLSNSIHLDLSEREMLGTVIADAERMVTLTDQVLVASGADAGLQVKLKLQPLSVIIDKLRRTDSRANVSMTQGLGMGPIDVATDPSMLAQLVALLVDNSYDHGAERVEIVVTDAIPGTIHHHIGTRPQSAIYIAVVDDGPGIDHTFLPTAFEAFQSGRRSRSKGMGLYLARTMVEAIDASLSVITSSKGTVMAIAVPARAGVKAA